MLPRHRAAGAMEAGILADGGGILEWHNAQAVDRGNETSSPAKRLAGTDRISIGASRMASVPGRLAVVAAQDHCYAIPGDGERNQLVIVRSERVPDSKRVAGFDFQVGFLKYALGTKTDDQEFAGCDLEG